MKITIDPFTGRPQISESPKVLGGGAAGGASRQSFVNLVTSDPTSGQDGDLIYNTTDSTLRIWITDAWLDIGTGSADISGGLDNLLLTDGVSMLTLQSDTVNDVLLLA